MTDSHVVLAGDGVLSATTVRAVNITGSMTLQRLTRGNNITISPSTYYDGITAQTISAIEETSGALSATSPVTVTAGRFVLGGATTIALNSASLYGMFSASAPLAYDSGTGAFSLTTPLAMQYGGSGKNLTASAGGIVWTDADSMEVLAGTGTANKILMSGSSATPFWSTPTYPTASPGAGTYLRGDGTNWITSTLILPNAATLGYLAFATATNTYGEDSGLNYDATNDSLGVGATAATANALTVTKTVTGTGSNKGAVITLAQTQNAASGNFPYALEATNNQNSNGNNQTGFILAMQAFADVSGAGTKSNVAGILSRTRSNTASGIISKGYAYYAAANLDASSGDTVDSYGFFSEAQTNGSSNNYGIYTAGTAAKNIFEGDTGVGAGTAGASTRAAVGGTLNVNTSLASNSGTGETDLATYSVPANSLATNGDYIEFDMFLTVSSSGNAKTIRVKYGATTIYTTAATVSNAGNINIRGRVIRTGATAQRSTASAIATPAAFAALGAPTTDTPAETLSGAVTFKVTGQGGASNEVNFITMTITWGSGATI